MKVLLVKPISTKATNITPCLGLGYLATAIRKNHRVKYLDCVKEKLSFEQFEQRLKELQPDVLGIQFFTCDHSSVLRMASLAKQLGCTVIVGGPHPSGIPQEALSHDCIDYGFQGEAELGFPLLLEALEKKGYSTFQSIPGLIYKEKNDIKINPVRFMETFDELPAWDLIRPDNYPLAPHGSFCKAKSAPIMVTRGCPFQCQYCAGKRSTGARLRKRPIENVITEIKMLHDQYGIKEIHIEDDNFTLDGEYAKEVCRAILKLDFKLHLACPNGVRLETLDEELLKLMEQAGFYSFAIGIESGNDRVLKKMGRHVTAEKMKAQIELIARVTKIRMTGFCMMGYPSETLAEMEDTATFTRTLPIHRVQYGNFHPLPGTPIFDELVREGEIDVSKIVWDRYQDNTISYSPKGVTPQQLKEEMSKAFKKFYFRPRIMWGLLNEIKSPQQAKILMKRALESFS